MIYKSLVDVYEKLSSTSKRLEKTFILANFLKKCDNIEDVLLLVQGKVFPAGDSRELGVAGQLVIKALSISTGISTSSLDKLRRATGDLGKTAKQAIQKKIQATLFSAQLTVSKVIKNFRKLAVLEGAGTVSKKIQLISELLSNASSQEAKYIIRTAIGDLRIGIGEGTVRDAILWAFLVNDKICYDTASNNLVINNKENYYYCLRLLKKVIDVTNDFCFAAQLSKEKGVKGLEDIGVVIGKPLKLMLFQKANDMQEAFNTVGRPAAVEYKYDGFRIQIHKSFDKIILFTRRLEDVTKQFPEIVRFVQGSVKGDEFILDAEAVGYDAEKKRYLPFQQVSRRIKRKYDVARMSQKFPMALKIFDIMFYDAEDLLEKPFKVRRAQLEKIVNPVKCKIQLAKQLITTDVDQAHGFYQESIKEGNEGVIFKNMNGKYMPGSRVGFGVKVKPVMKTLEVVITKAETGTGKRSQWFSSFTISVYDSVNERFLEIGKVGTGLKEKEEIEGVSFSELTNILKQYILKEKGRTVLLKPEVVIEVNYEEIQKSPKYDSGYALRFPRLVRLREDRSPADISTKEEIEELFVSQRKIG